MLEVKLKQVLVYIVIILTTLNSCAVPESEKQEQISSHDQRSTKSDSTYINKYKNTADSSASENVDDKSNRVAPNTKDVFEIKTFKHSDYFGFDILHEGRTLIHQPIIPARQGNNGFMSERDAIIVATLMVTKIRNNIMPPTISVEELDSMGIK